MEHPVRICKQWRYCDAFSRRLIWQHWRLNLPTRSSVPLFIFYGLKDIMQVLFTVKMRLVHGDKCFMRPAIHAWRKEFACGIKSVDDKKRPGWHVVATTDAMTATINEFVWSDRCMSISDTVRHTGISGDSTHRIVQNHLKFPKICALWVPKQLMPDQQATRMMTSLHNLQRYKMEGEALHERIVTGDETWVHCYQPESSKQASKQRKHKESPTPTKFKVLVSARKVIATMFWDIKGVLRNRVEL